MSDEILELVESIKPLLAARHRVVQGAVLAELLSMWLAGHYLGGEELVEQILQQHIECVRRFLPAQIDILKKRRS